MAYKSPERTKPRTVYTSREFEDQLLFLRDHYKYNSSEVIRLAVADLYARIRREPK